ncbi:hypothetical protein L1887_60167 [Cichorium endivia]|nr:hypothetical protein L1887_60167 [Cichorium endivia]
MSSTASAAVRLRTAVRDSLDSAWAAYALLGWSALHTRQKMWCMQSAMQASTGPLSSDRPDVVRRRQRAGRRARSWRRPAPPPHWRICGWVAEADEAAAAARAVAAVRVAALHLLAVWVCVHDHTERKRRRHSTLSSSGVASGSDDDERAPPTVRLRLGSYVSEFRIAGSRSSSPGTGRSTSPLLTTTAPPRDDDQDDGADADVDMDLEVQSTFQAMQVDSPHCFTLSVEWLLRSSGRLDALPNTPPPNLVSGATAGVLAPLLIEPRYATPSRSPVQTNLALPSISALATATTVQPGMFPSASLIASSPKLAQ